MSDVRDALLTVLIFGSIIGIPIAGWITNIIWTFQQTQAGPVILGIFSMILFPIGVIHGIWVWFA